MHKKLFPYLLILIVLALSACSGSEVAEEETVAETVIVVNMEDIYFGPTNDNAENPPEWTVTTGAEVTLRMENMGALEHSWAILEPGVDVPVAYDEAVDGDKILFSSGNVAAGTNDEVRFAAPAPGTYNVLCTVPGHSAIMQGRLIITA